MRNTLGYVVPWGSCGFRVFTDKITLVVLVSRVCLGAVANVFLGLVATGEPGWWGA